MKQKADRSKFLLIRMELFNIFEEYIHPELIEFPVEAKKLHGRVRDKLGFAGSARGVENEWVMEHDSTICGLSGYLLWFSSISRCSFMSMIFAYDLKKLSSHVFPFSPCSV